MAAEILSSGLTEWKRLKIASRDSVGTPGPSSSIRIRISSPTWVAAISTSPPGGEKEMALSMILSIARASRSASPITTAVPARGPGEGDPRVAGLAAASPSSQTSCSISGAEVDRLEGRARQLGVGARGLADVDDQPVEPDDVLADDVEQLLAQRRVLDPVERVDRRAQRGERVLELVGHVGGEGLDIVDPLAQRLAHVVNRAGEQPDLVAARGQAGHIDLARPAEPHAMRGEREPAQRPAIVRARKSDSRTERRTTPIRIERRASALGCGRTRDVAVVDGEQQHVCRRRRPARGAEMTGVRSGALRTSSADRFAGPAWASGQASSGGRRPGSTKSSAAAWRRRCVEAAVERAGDVLAYQGSLAGSRSS